jgi:hypothetical protein
MVLDDLSRSSKVNFFDISMVLEQTQGLKTYYWHNI